MKPRFKFAKFFYLVHGHDISQDIATICKGDLKELLKQMANADNQHLGAINHEKAWQDAHQLAMVLIILIFCGTENRPISDINFKFEQF